MKSKSKGEFVKSLKRVKLILGNGFDLHCGLHTRYYDYYCKHIDRYLFIDKLFKEYKKNGAVAFKNKKINKITVWDAFFAINASSDTQINKKEWCDIEKIMLSSFLSKEESELSKDNLSVYIASRVHWEIIKNNVERSINVSDPEYRFIDDFVTLKMKEKSFFPNDFYKFLLAELKQFEASFGQFIYAQQHETWFEHCNPGQVFPNLPYIEKATDTINKLCDTNNLVSIDSFNYGKIVAKEISDKLQHINGDIDMPIFGIDSVFDPGDERFIFTKTGRRIDCDLFDESFETKPDFENIIVFGHSLNDADYSYFFPIFDKMQLTNTLASNTVVFAYDIYDTARESEIKSRLLKSISRILFSYAIDKKVSNPNRFLDSLSTQKRIVVYNIPTLDRNDYRRSDVDREWEEAEEKFKKLTEEECTKEEALKNYIEINGTDEGFYDYE